MELIVYETPEELAAGAAQRIAGLIAESPDVFTFGLAGGSSPASTYEALRDHEVNWSGVDAWLSDERWVPHDHERSNGHMAAEALMDHVPARFHRPTWSEFIEPADSAAHYEATLRTIHGDRRPDLILLGMGEDAHTASLFPGSRALDETSRWFVDNEIPETGEDRLTATYPMLWLARRLMVLTAGSAKAPALRDAFEDVPNPIRRIADGEAEVEWHVDRAAASLLS